MKRETTRVSSTTWLLLMLAECSANKVALVRTRSINEIKTKHRERPASVPFPGIASLPMDSFVRLGVGLSGRGIIAIGTPSDYVRPLFHPLRLHATRASAYFVRGDDPRIGERGLALGRIINARNNSHERQSTDIGDINYARLGISPLR